MMCEQISSSIISTIEGKKYHITTRTSRIICQVVNVTFEMMKGCWIPELRKKFEISNKVKEEFEMRNNVVGLLWSIHTLYMPTD